MEKLEVNSSSLFVAGSETTATLLSGATYLLLSHRDVLTKAVDEVRSSFENEAQITLSSVVELRYLQACLSEALRCYPPAPNVLHRLVPRGGCTIASHHVAEGVSSLPSLLFSWELTKCRLTSQFTNTPKTIARNTGKNLTASSLNDSWMKVTHLTTRSMHCSLSMSGHVTV
jgi:hypothetical protein